MLDMAFGAFGWYIGAEDIDPDAESHSGMFGVLSPEALGRWIGAVARHLLHADPEDTLHYLLKPHCLAHWDSLDEIVDMLFVHGVRASPGKEPKQ